MPASLLTPAVIRQIVLEVDIDAPRERVWKALVEDIGAWWHRDSWTGPDPVGFFVQPRLGGFMYEDWGEGNGLVWGTVIGLRAPQRLEVVGDSSPEWGGPNRGHMTWEPTQPPRGSRAVRVGLTDR